jgi:hypothetical protein
MAGKRLTPGSVVVLLTALTAGACSHSGTTRNASRDARSGRRYPAASSKEEEAGSWLDDDSFLAARAFPYKTVPPVVVERAQAATRRLPITHPTPPATQQRSVPRPVYAARARAARSGIRVQGGLAQKGTPDAAAAVAVGATWNPKGPRPTKEIYGFTDPYGGTPPWSGRVSALAMNPTNANIAYLGAASGGVWKTTDGGANWAPTFDGQASLSIGALAVDPQNSNTVYAATGEANDGPDSYYGGGLFKSTDGAATWTKIGGTQFDSCHLASIAVRPGNSSVLLLAVQGPPTWTVGVPGLDYGARGPSDCTPRQGLYRSTNGGTSWTRVLAGVPTDVAVAAAAPAIWFAGVRGTGVWKSTDSGATWSQLTGGPPTSGGGRVAIAVAPSNPSRIYVFVAKQADATSNDTPLLGAWTSSNAGATWATLATPPAFCESSTNQCDYDLTLAADPATASTLYAGGTGLYKFTNSGAKVALIGGFKGNYTGPDVVHWDQHALAFDASRRLWIGNDGGVYRTADGGTHFANLNATLSITQFTSIAGWPTIGGTQDNGSQFDNGGQVWLQYEPADGGPAAVNPQNEATFYGSSQLLGAFKSFDVGSSASPATFGIPDETERQFYSPFVLDPAHPNLLYAGTVRVYRSATAGQTWASFSPDFIGGRGRVTALGVASSNTNALYAASVRRSTKTIDFQRTTDGGVTWVSRKTGLPLAFVNGIVVDPKVKTTVYAAMGGFGHGHLYRSTNGGDTWANISGDLPDLALNALAVDFRTSPPTLFAANDVGVFVSTNAGVSWARFGTGLPNVIVTSLVLDPQSGSLVAGTYGRGVWESYPDGTATVPGNNSFANASLISGTDGLMIDSSVGATKETGEPSHAGRTGGASIWYRWIAPASGLISMNTIGSNFDTVLAVYEGDAVNTLTPVAANDDISGTNLASALQFTAVAGHTYRIAIDGYAGTSGVPNLFWSSKPLNDAFAGARTVGGTSGRVIVGNNYASGQTGEPSVSDPSPSHKTLWFKWTAPSTGTLTVSAPFTGTFNVSYFYNLIGVYTGTSVTSLTMKAAKDRNHDSVAVAVTAGTTYYFQLDTVAGAAGTLALDWSE